MASRNRRPIVMNRNKRPGKTRTIFRKVLVITAVLAFIEVIILLVIHFKNSWKTGETKQSSDISQATIQDRKPAAIQELQKEAPKKSPKKLLTVAKPDSVIKRDTDQQIKTVPLTIKPLEKRSLKDSIVKKLKPQQELLEKQEPAVEAKKVATVSDEKMAEILGQIKAAKNDANGSAKCVTIQIVNNSNAENGFKIANYLRKNGYVISGREVIQGSLEGIRISAAGPCLKLAVGGL